MSRSVSDRRFIAPLAVAVAVVTLAGATRVAAQEARGDESRILSSEIAVSRQEAAMELEFDDGRTLDLAIRDGNLEIDGESVASASRGSPLDRAWRQLLNQAIDAPTDELTALLTGWDAPEGEAGDRLEAQLRDAVGGLAMPDAADAPALAENDADAQTSDSVGRLLERISELESMVDELEDEREVVIPPVRAEADGDGGWTTPFRYIANGLAGTLSILVAYAVLFGIGFVTIYFGGRRYIEGVADTARYATTRSLLVGLAASFLLIPAFIIGIIALAISIVGIPALFLWIPLFPVAAGGALLLGYLAVAHAAGESLAERRFYATDWFQRGNSYYFLMTGLGLLVALFIAGQIVSMAGPWLGFLSGTLMALGMVVTWAALSIGVGAVLLSRGGTRPVRSPAAAATPEPDIYAEETNV